MLGYPVLNYDSENRREGIILGLFNVDTFDGSLKFSTFTAYQNSELYNYWPDSGNQNRSNFNAQVAVAGDIVPWGKYYTFGDVTIDTTSNGFPTIKVSGTTVCSTSTSYDVQIYIFFILNDTDKSYRVGCYYDDGTYVQVRQGSKTVNATIYDKIVNSIRIYNWQSISSISGNGNTYNLSQIKDDYINGGDPVSNATLLAFNSLGNVNIRNIIEPQLPEEEDKTIVIASYLIPILDVGTYESIKLAIKKDSIPTSLSDADKVITLTEPTTITRIDSIAVYGLDEETHYYFMIYVEDDIGNIASSEPQDIITGERPIVPSPEIIMIVEKALIDGYEEYISTELVQ